MRTRMLYGSARFLTVLLGEKFLQAKEFFLEYVKVFL